MTQFKYVLEPYKSKNSRYTCPSCKQPHQFTRYIDIQTNAHIANHVGICNRASKCGYHYTPKQYFQDNPQYEKSLPKSQPQPQPQSQPQPPSFINPQLFQKTISNYNKNNLIKYLDSIFDKQTVNHLINIYKIGTSSRYNGGTTIFWQIDMQGNIRTGKLIKYNPITGKRQKKPYVATNWVHAIQCQKEFNLVQCLFGEHLLNEDPSAPIAIVESEKTAIIAQAKMPDFLWMATGSLNEFKPSKLNVLKGRRVVAYPDLSAYGRWFKKAGKLDFHIEVSDYLEKNATEEQRKEGLDIADFL